MGQSRRPSKTLWRNFSSPRLKALTWSTIATQRVSSSTRQQRPKVPQRRDRATVGPSSGARPSRRRRRTDTLAKCSWDHTRLTAASSTAPSLPSTPLPHPWILRRRWRLTRPPAPRSPKLCPRHSRGDGAASKTTPTHHSRFSRPHKGACRCLSVGSAHGGAWTTTAPPPAEEGTGAPWTLTLHRWRRGPAEGATSRAGNPLQDDGGPSTRTRRQLQPWPPSAATAFQRNALLVVDGARLRRTSTRRWPVATSLHSDRSPRSGQTTGNTPDEGELRCLGLVFLRSTRRPVLWTTARARGVACISRNSRKLRRRAEPCPLWRSFRSRLDVGEARSERRVRASRRAGGGWPPHSPPLLRHDRDRSTPPRVLPRQPRTRQRPRRRPRTSPRRLRQPRARTMALCRWGRGGRPNRETRRSLCPRRRRRLPRPPPRPPPRRARAGTSRERARQSKRTAGSHR
mmetsp:Transcript_50865/g.119199  ORF Transcript_50865/g.119199 Transcript_50865/m.119199 type:complete len:457 (-) Transcript_50865:1245-2615(-)